MGVTVRLSTRQKHYVAGDVIEGIVNLTVAKSKAGGSPANDLTLKLTGAANTSALTVYYGTGAQTTTTQSDEFLSYEVKLRSFEGTAANGTYSFPFSVMLPPGLPSSMKVSKDSDNFCSIEYGLEARLDRPGIFNSDAKDKSEITIFNKPQENAANNVPIRVDPETETVTNWCCSSRGSISLGFEADRSVIRINDPATLTVVVRNDSRVPVGSMRIKVKQVCAWHAGSHTRKEKRSILCATVPGSALGEVHPGQGAPVVADAAQHSLREMQASGAGTRHELLIPNKCLQTLKSALIEVSHTLILELDPKSGPNSLHVSTPIHVQAANVLLVVAPETTAIGLPSAEANAGEGLGLLSVPQSGVKSDFIFEFSQPLATTT